MPWNRKRCRVGHMPPLCSVIERNALLSLAPAHLLAASPQQPGIRPEKELEEIL